MIFRVELKSGEHLFVETSHKLDDWHRWINAVDCRALHMHTAGGVKSAIVLAVDAIAYVVEQSAMTSPAVRDDLSATTAASTTPDVGNRAP